MGTRDGLIYMDKKHLYIIIAMALVVGAGIIFALLNGNKPGTVSTAPAGNGTSASKEQTKISQTYSPNIPAGATPSVAKAEAPANSNPNSDAKIKFFDLRATKSGFSISQIVVTQNDSLSVNFTAMDGDYDLDIPYLAPIFP